MNNNSWVQPQPRFPCLKILRFGEPPQHAFGVREIVEHLERDYDRLWWVVLEHSREPMHDMSFEADEGNVTATEDGRFYESVRTDLKLADVRPALIKFLRGDPGWQTEIEWKCDPSHQK